MLAESTKQEDNARANTMGQNLLKCQQIAPSAWLRGDIADAWRSNEQNFDVAAYDAPRSNHDDVTGRRTSICIPDLQESGETTPSSTHIVTVKGSCDSANPIPVPAKSSIRLNRFERHTRDGEEMHLLIVRRQLKRQPNGELKFRTDFEACFKEFPLENIYAQHWTCRTPVSAQESARSSRGSRTPPGELGMLSVFSQRDDDVDLDACNVYEYARLKGLMEDILLPRNSDGTIMAELDASPTEPSCSDKTSAMSKSGRLSEMEPAAILAPRVKSDRLSKKLAALRPLSWAKRASVHLKQIRQNAKIQQQDLLDDCHTSAHYPSVASWTIKATEDGPLYHHSALDQSSEPGSPAVPSFMSSPTGMRDEAQSFYTTNASADTGESESEADTDDATIAEETIVGGCWVSIASHEQ